jgi:hypothetical protein
LGDVSQMPLEVRRSFVGLLKETRGEAAAKPDPWRLRLERIRGKVGDDGIERISTQCVFDVLEVPQRSRGAGACRRLAAIMRDLHWRSIKAGGLNQRGLLEQIRGYARDHRRSPLS